MKATGEKRYLKMAMAGLPAVVIAFGLSSGSVLAEDDRANYEAYKKNQAEKQLPPHGRPAPAEPPTGGHANLDEAVTNPVAFRPVVMVRVVY